MCFTTLPPPCAATTTNSNLSLWILLIRASLFSSLRKADGSVFTTPAENANKKCPARVIQFYEKHLKFVG